MRKQELFYVNRILEGMALPTLRFRQLHWTRYGEAWITHLEEGGREASLARSAPAGFAEKPKR
jgi:hypothetical protein